MKMSELRSVVKNLVKTYWQGATIVEAKQTNTQPPMPYVTLGWGKLIMATFSNTIDEESEAIDCRIRLTVNLYTDGKARTKKNNTTTNYENTAIEDMMSFVDYLSSEYALAYMVENNISILQDGLLEDLSDLETDTQYRYRAIAEFIVSFQNERTGYYGISSDTIVPTASGGGTEEQKNTPIGYFTEAEIEEDENG